MSSSEARRCSALTLWQAGALMAVTLGPRRSGYPCQRLAYLGITAESGLPRKIAARLNVAPSAVSCKFVLLESVLETSLLERTPHGIRFIPVGEMALAYRRQNIVLNDAFITWL